jgi:hypothetical protein
MIGEQRTAFVTVNGQVFRMQAENLWNYGQVIKAAMDQEGLDIGRFDKKKFIKGLHDAWAERGGITPPPGFEPFATYLGYLSYYIKIFSAERGARDYYSMGGCARRPAEVCVQDARSKSVCEQNIRARS